MLEALEERRLLAFAHPGVLSTQADFDRIITQVNAGAQPWTNAKNALLGDGYTATNWSPRPVETLIRGGDGQNFGTLIVDMLRAYQTAVAWKITGNSAYANQSVAILNAWSSTNTALAGNADRFLASGLYAFGWAASADIMRTYPGWATADVTQFQNYLLNVYYPLQTDFLNGGHDGIAHNGAYVTNYWANWDMANIEGMMAIGIFADRQDIYDEAIDYLYNGDGNGTLDNQVYYQHTGNLWQFQESGRDQGHTTLGMALGGHIAQMAWNQGLDLFSYNNYQLLGTAEYVAKYNLWYDVPYEPYYWGNGVNGTWSSQTNIGGGSRGNGRYCYELLNGHYVGLLGMDAKYSEMRAAGIGMEYRGDGDQLGWGTLLFSQPTAATPQAPRGLTARADARGNIQLDWFGGNNVASYNIHRATSLNGAYTEVASGVNDLLTYTDRNLPAGTYFYKITGINGAIETAASNIASETATTLVQTQLPFNEGSGGSANDSSGNLHNGALLNGASWGTGKTGTAVSLDGSNDYVALPANLMTDVADFTISTWVYLNSAPQWSRIFDFGNTTDRWMFLTPNGGGVVQFATGTVYGYNKQSINGTAPLPTNQWVHVAVTLSDRVGRLYVNGVLVGSNANMSFPPYQIVDTANNWLGRSQYPDPYLNGKIDDFKITRGAMTSGEIYTEATGTAAPAVPSAPATVTATAVVGNQINLSWSSVAGATGGYSVWRSTTAGGPYTPLATMMGGTTYNDGGRVAGQTYYYVVTAANNGGDSANSVQASAVALPPMPGVPASLTAASNTPTSIALSWSAAGNAASYTTKRSLTTGGPYTIVASGITATSYTNTGLTSETPYYYVVTAVNASGESSSSNEASSIPTSLRARLTFNQVNGTTVPDVTGSGWNGTLVNGSALNTGKLSSAVDLDGTDDHVTLPSGVVNGLTDFTISTWVNPDVVTMWQRIFDIGTGTNTYMLLTPRGATNVPRFAITTSGNGSEQQLNGTAALTAGVWTHIAVTLSGTTGRLYVNGVLVNTNTSMTLNPSSLGNTTQNYLGRSQFSGDPYFNGRIDDFRIYTQALSGAEVQALATTAAPAVPANVTATKISDSQIDLSWSSVSAATGYNLLRSTTSGGPYTIIASHLAGANYQDTNVPAALATGTTYYYVVNAENAGGESNNSTQVSATVMPPAPGPATDLTATATTSGAVALSWTAGSDVAGYKVSRSTSANGTYTIIAPNVMATTYNDTGLTDGVTYYYLVTAINASGEAEAVGASVTPTDLHARLKFDETSGATAGDSSGHFWNGTLTNGPSWYVSGKLNRALDLDGSNDYVALPTCIVSGLTTATFSAWVYLDSLGNSSRIFDFGTGTNTYMFLSPQSGANARFAITTGSYGSEEQIIGNAPLPTGGWTHVAVTLNGSTGTFFVNGTAVGTNNAMTLSPSSLGNTTQNYLGKSQWGSDSYLNGRIDDFRIYSRALSAAEVTTLRNSTVPGVPTGLSATAGNAQVSLNWNSVSGAAGYKLSRSTSSSGPFTPIATALSSTSYLDTDVSNGTTYYYVVSAYNIVDGSSNSSSVNATPAAPVLLTGSGFAYEALPYQLTFTFDGSRSFSTADLIVTPSGGGAALPASGYQWNSATNTATFELAGPLPDGNYTASLPGGYSFPFFVLAGDSDHDGVVDSIDFNTFVGHYGGSGKDFADGDFNYDNKVNTLDFNILAGHFGITQPLPAPLVSVSLQKASALFNDHTSDYDELDAGNG